MNGRKTMKTWQMIVAVVLLAAMLITIFLPAIHLNGKSLRKALEKVVSGEMVDQTAELAGIDMDEISPIIGSEEQANDLIDYINGQKTDENANIWDTNIFGKTIEQIVKDGIVAKISGMSDETQGRMQNTIEKITNDQSKGVICILL